MLKNYGLGQERIRDIILSAVTKNADLKYYINNDYIYMLVDAMVDGVSKAIEENTEEVFKNMKKEMRMR